VRTMLLVTTVATLMGSSMAFAFTANTTPLFLSDLHTKSTLAYAAHYHTHIQSYSGGMRRDITRYSIERYYTRRPHVHY
jgi:hypothetical protein